MIEKKVNLRRGVLDKVVEGGREGERKGRDKAENDISEGYSRLQLVHCAGPRSPPDSPAHQVAEPARRATRDFKAKVKITRVLFTARDGAYR